MTAVWAVVIGLALLILFLAMLVVGLLRSHAEILRRLDKLGVRLDDDQQGSEPITLTTTASLGDAADIAGLDPNGEPVILSPAAGRDPVLLAFLSTSCSSCSVFWETFDATWIDIESKRYRVVIVTLGADEESPTRAGKLRTGGADVVMSSDAWNAYEVPGAPYFVLVDAAKGRVFGEGTSATVDALRGFLRDASNDLEWDQSQRGPDTTDADRERMIDDELRRAGLEPGDPRLYHKPADEGEA